MAKFDTKGWAVDCEGRCAIISAAREQSLISDVIFATHRVSCSARGVVWCRIALHEVAALDQLDLDGRASSAARASATSRQRIVGTTEIFAEEGVRTEAVGLVPLGEFEERTFHRQWNLTVNGAA